MRSRVFGLFLDDPTGTGRSRGSSCAYSSRPPGSPPAAPAIDHTTGAGMLAR
jgi:hypothetical protein